MSNKIMDFENMDLTKLRDKLFIVAVSSGDRNKCKLLASTIHGPYKFAEMAEQVGLMWETQQHHAKVTVLDPDPNKRTQFLDEETTDYIEAKWHDILVDDILLGDGEDIDYTCEASIIEDDEGRAED